MPTTDEVHWVASLFRLGGSAARRVNGPMSCEKKLFAVVTVTRDDLPGLRVTGESLLGQTSDDYRWIVIDGSSRDGTVKWLDETLRATEHLWISEPDDSIYDAMNKGLDRASCGRYVLFLNSGDSLADAQTLSVIERAIEQHDNPAFVYGDAIDQDGNGACRERKARDVGFLPIGMFARHQSMFFDVARVGDLRYRTALKYSADYAFVYEFLQRTKGEPEICYVGRPLCKFALGGIHETRRLDAIGEDFYIRKSIMGLGVVRSTIVSALSVGLHVVKKNRVLAGWLLYSKPRG